jgi:hypothetical protein
VERNRSHAANTLRGTALDVPKQPPPPSLGQQGNKQLGQYCQRVTLKELGNVDINGH